MARLLERSDPYIVHLTTKLRPAIYCSECGANDHTLRSHRRKSGEQKTEYYTAKEELFID